MLKYSKCLEENLHLKVKVGQGDFQAHLKVKVGQGDFQAHVLGLGLFQIC